MYKINSNLSITNGGSWKDLRWGDATLVTEDDFADNNASCYALEYLPLSIRPSICPSIRTGRSIRTPQLEKGTGWGKKELAGPSMEVLPAANRTRLVPENKHKKTQIQPGWIFFGQNFEAKTQKPLKETFSAVFWTRFSLFPIAQAEATTTMEATPGTALVMNRITTFLETKKRPT